MKEAELCRQHQPCQKNVLLSFSRAETRSDQARQPRREDLAGDHQSHEQDSHDRYDRRENAPAFFFAVFRGIFGEDRDEGDGQRPSCNEVVQKIGQRKRSIISVGQGVRAHLMGHGPFANESQQTAQQDSAHHDGCRG